MSKVIDWVKKNWLLVLLVSIIAFLITSSPSGGVITSRSNTETYDMGLGNAGGAAMLSKDSIARDGFVPEAAPVAQEERLVVQDTDVSLLVEDVAASIKTIENSAVSLGGYMVNKYLNQPEGAATGYITIRVPVEKRETALDTIRKAGVKVVSENVNGTDVTDQFVDLQERIDQLEKTKARMQAIMDQASRISDLVDIQNQLNNIQRQIDNAKGQQNYLEQTAKLTRITVNLSTDELALPYTPDEAWRPEAVFKNAVRAMIQVLRFLASGVIWGVVFLPVIAIVMVVVWIAKFVKNRLGRK